MTNTKTDTDHEKNILPALGPCTFHSKKTAYQNLSNVLQNQEKMTGKTVLFNIDTLNPSLIHLSKETA